jgi:rubrerythrin
MPIENRNLSPGTVLVATYKKAAHTCEVVEREGKTLYEYAGKTYTSPSAAGSAVMGGVSCNGWRFWSVEGTEPAPKPAKATETATRTENGKKLLRQIKRVPNQKGVAEGSTKWFCSACMNGFVAEGKSTPETCPEGHAREVEDDLAAPSES